MPNLIRPKRQPGGCVEENPTKASISFAGVWINLSAISRSQHLDKGYLSRLFSGEKPNVSLFNMRKIAAAIGFSLDDLAAGLEERWRLIQANKTEQEIQYLTRVIQEDEEDLATLRKGKPVVIRNAGERLPEHTHR
jgi:hypothetical protein